MFHTTPHHQSKVTHLQFMKAHNPGAGSALSYLHARSLVIDLLKFARKVLAVCAVPIELKRISVPSRTLLYGKALW
jgi:hypothetical protein